MIINGDCPELSETRWSDHPEFCPVLVKVVQPDVTLPGLTDHSMVQAELDRVKVEKAFSENHCG
jgi:hypothetical protein